MFYFLKKRIIFKALEKKNKQNPFDFQYAEKYILKGDEDPLINNSYYFSAHDEKMSVFVRLGKRVNAEETWFAIYLDDKIVSLRQEVFPNGDAPIQVEKVDDRWTISYHGKLEDNEDTDFHATFIPTQRPIDFTSNMPAVRMATGIANEKWSKAYFQDLQNISGQCHYEQEGVLEGQLTIDGKTTDFHLPCVRDHSFGKRDWNYMNNHLWLMAVSPTHQFNYSLVSYPALSVLEVGNYRDETGMHYLLQADLDFHQISQGTVPQELSFNVTLDNGRQINVRAKTLKGVTYHFQEGQYTLHENIATFSIAGKAYRGIFEIGFNSDSHRYFNHRDLNSLKR